jgi:hypothetical protein
MELELPRDKAVYYIYTKEIRFSDKVFIATFSPLDWCFIAKWMRNDKHFIEKFVEIITNYDGDGGSDEYWKNNSDATGWYKSWVTLRRRGDACLEAVFKRFENSVGDADSWAEIIYKESFGYGRCTNSDFYEEKMKAVASIDDLIRIYNKYERKCNTNPFVVAVGCDSGASDVIDIVGYLLTWHVEHSQLTIEQLRAIPCRSNETRRQMVKEKIGELEKKE